MDIASGGEKTEIIIIITFVSILMINGFRYTSTNDKTWQNTIQFVYFK